jgi:hypothetical protein
MVSKKSKEHRPTNHRILKKNILRSLAKCEKIFNVEFFVQDLPRKYYYFLT